MLSDEQAGRMLANRRLDKANCAYQRAFGCTRFDGARISALLFSMAGDNERAFKRMNQWASRLVRRDHLTGDALLEAIADLLVANFRTRNYE
jgi:hypothetical protein